MLEGVDATSEVFGSAVESFGEMDMFDLIGTGMDGCKSEWEGESFLFLEFYNDHPRS